MPGKTLMVLPKGQVSSVILLMTLCAHHWRGRGREIRLRLVPGQDEEAYLKVGKRDRRGMKEREGVDMAARRFANTPKNHRRRLAPLPSQSSTWVRDHYPYAPLRR